MDSWLVYSTKHIFLLLGGPFIQENCCFLPKHRTTIATLGTSGYTSHRCASQASQLGSINVFLPLVIYIAKPGTIKLSPQGEGIQVSSKSIPLTPMSKAHVVFSNRSLSSTSGRQPRAIAVVYIVWGVLFGESFRVLRSTAHIRFFIHGTGGVCQSMVLGGNIITPSAPAPCLSSSHHYNVPTL